MKQTTTLYDQHTTVCYIFYLHSLLLMQIFCLSHSFDILLLHFFQSLMQFRKLLSVLIVDGLTGLTNLC